jgi:hypothetical protein
MRFNFEPYKPLVGKTVEYHDVPYDVLRWGQIKEFCRFKFPPIKRGGKIIKCPSIAGFKVKHPVLGNVKVPIDAIKRVRWYGKDIPVKEWLDNVRGRRQSIGTPKAPRNVEAAPITEAKESTTSPDSSYPAKSEKEKATEE